MSLRAVADARNIPLVITMSLHLRTSRDPIKRVSRRWLVACLVLTMFTLAGCGKPRPTFNQALDGGIRDYRAKAYSDAVVMFEIAQSLDRERPEPSFYIGRCYLGLAGREFQENDLPAALRYCDRAIASFDDAISAYPGFSRAVQGKADALKLKGMHQAALDLVDWAVAHSGLLARKLIIKGRQYSQAGDMDHAQLTFEQAVAMEPKNAAAHAELGLFYMRCENPSAAIRSLKEAYRLNPGAPGVAEALIHLGAKVTAPHEAE